MSLTSIHAEAGEAEITAAAGTATEVSAALIAAGTPADVRVADDNIFIVPQAVADGADLPAGTLVASVTVVS